MVKMMKIVRSIKICLVIAAFTAFPLPAIALEAALAGLAWIAYMNAIMLTFMYLLVKLAYFAWI